MGLVAPRHVGSSQTRDRTRVPCIGRWILFFVCLFLFLFFNFLLLLFFMLFLSAYILFMYVCMYVCMYGCIGSSFLCEGFL